MALVLADRVKETTTTTGTGTVTLAGVSAGYQSFAAIGNGNTTYYTISGQTTSEWEVGIGTYTSSGTTLSRTTVLSSSNSGSLVNFSAGTKDVFVTYPAGRSVNADAANTVVSVPQLSATSITDSGNLTFTGTGNRITGDFSNGTVANRPVFQSSTVNGATRVSLITNGTGVASELLVFNGSDPANAGFGSVRINASDFAIQALQNGTGTYLPINLVTNASNKLTIAADATGTFTFGGTAPRITGDFSNATVASRVMFQTTGTNISTIVSAIPSGTGVGAGFRAYSLADPTNASVGSFDINSSTGLVFINSGITGTGTYLPFAILTGGSERMRLDTSGRLLVGTSSVLGAAADAVQILQSGSPGIAIGISTIPSSAFSIAGIGAYGNDGSTYIAGGTINFRAAENWSATNHGTDIQFRVTASGSGGALAEAMRIASTGYVGIGTSAPTVPLNVVSSSAVTAGQPSIILQGSSNTERLGIRSTSASIFVAQFANGTLASPTAVTTDNFLGGYQFGGYAATLWTRGAQIAGYAAGTWTDTSTPAYIAFQTVPSGATGLLERMRIDSAGNVGIGMTPVYQFDITTGASNGIRLNASSGQVNIILQQAGVTNGSINAAGGAGTDLNIYATRILSLNGGTDSLRMFSNSSERMRITSAGDVGIGTTAPGAKLEINGGVLGGTSGDQTILERLYGTVTNASYLDISLTRDSAGTSWINAATRLQQKIDSTWMGFMQFNGTNNQGGITFGAGTSTVSATSIPEYMYLNSSGQVGIGTSAPTGKLDVRTAAGVVAQSNLYTGSNASVVKFNIGQVGAIDWDIGLSASAGNFYIGGLGGSMAEAYRITRTGVAIDFQTWNTNGSERIRITSAGDFGVGTSSPAGRIEASSSSQNIVVSRSTGSYAAFQRIAPTGQQAYDFYTINSVEVARITGDPSYLAFSTGSSATERMRIDSAGIVTMSAYGAGAATFSAAGVISSVSDETWKIKDGVPVDVDSMLNKLEPGYWYYNDEKKEIFGVDRQLGFYAQNVNAAIGPEAAPAPEEGKPWGYYDRSVLAVTVMSLQKALATIESLTARIEALESR